MRKFSLILVFMILMGGMVFAQKAPVAVDVPSAQSEINDLETQNSTMADENDDLEYTISVLQSEIQDTQALMREIAAAQSRISGQAGELYSAMQGVTDVEMRTRLNAQISSNRAQRYALDQKINELNGIIEDHNYLIEKDRRWINRNNLQTKNNNARISYLTSCISFTETEGLGMDEAIEKSQGIQSEVDALLAQNPAPSASVQ